MAGIASALNRSSSCNITTVQGIVNNLGLNETNATVEFTYRLDSNYTIAAFKSVVGAANFQTDIPPVCAIRINGSTNEGANFDFAALLPDTWNNRIM
jgi:feruloyl esterase